MFVPHDMKEIGEFATDLIQRCSVSMKARIERGAMYRNVFLTGDPTGSPQTYKKTYAYLDDLASMLYSPVELRFAVTPHGRAGPRERALGHAAAAQLNSAMRSGDVDAAIEDAVVWSLIKGKTFIQLLWTKKGLEPHLIMPEQFGVLEEGKEKLEAQKAFFHRIWYTMDDFRDKIAHHPKRDVLMQAAKAYAVGKPDASASDENYSATRMVLLGGLYPYQVSASPIPGQRSNRGIVDWLTMPQPQLAPETSTEMVAFDELWVWNSENEDWVTIQLLGPDCVILPHIQLVNAFADWHDPNRRTIVPVTNDNNPLRGKHNFVEFCVNRTPQYFWGDSEVRIIGSLQTSLNARVDGINKVLRKQENPPRIISGASINQNALAKLNRPGGYLTDSSPQFKHEELMPQVPPDFWTSLDRILNMFHDMGGLPAVMRGEGETGIRSQGHAETLVRTASPRFKDRALAIERSCDAVGALSLDILRAKEPEEQIAWVTEKAAGPFAAENMRLDPDIFEPPADGLVGILFHFYDILENQKVAVDAHSSSPIFAQELFQKIITLVRIGAITPREAIELTHPPREDQLLDATDQREAARAAFVQQHPEVLSKGSHGGRRR